MPALVELAIPLIGLRGVAPRPPRWLQAAAGSGLLMTLLYLGLSMFPIIQVTSVTTFALKITLVLVGLNLLGVGILAAGRRRSGLTAETGA